MSRLPFAILLFFVALIALTQARTSHAQGIIAAEAGVFHDVDRPKDTDIGAAPFTAVRFGYEVVQGLHMELSMGFAFYDFDATLSGAPVTLSEEVFRALFGMRYVFHMKPISPWISGALGNAWIITKEKTVQLAGQSFHLKHRQNSEFAMSLGTGCDYPLDKRWTASFGALFTDVTNEGKDFKFMTYTVSAAYAF